MKCFNTKVSVLVFGMGLKALAAQSQISFTNASSRLSTSDFNSGVGISVADMDGDGLDDIARMNHGYQLQLQIQRTGQPFAAVNGVYMGNESAWSMVVGDVNGDGYKDAMAGFGTGAKLSIANGAGTGFNAATTLPSSGFFLQNMNCMDVDNDGDVDIFGCNDNGESKIWVNNGNGTFTVSNIINFDVTPNIPGNSSTDDSGNYGSVWSDFDNDGDVDFYIAKCRQGVGNSADPRRINLLFVNNGDGTYTENAAAYGLKIGAQSWTANFDDINNDGWLDVLITNHDVQTMLMLNDGTGHFTDINVGNAAGLNVNFTPYQSKMVDFDNDGWLDILITGSSGNASSGRLFRNNHNNTFTAVTNAFPSSANNAIHSFGVGDLNHDGKMDIYAGYAIGYTTPSGTDDILWLNTTNNNNHFVTFNLQGTVSNRDALGARVFIYGDWGVQTREVRAGESYGTCNTFNLHFGLGAATMIDSAIIKWPSGIVDKLFNKPADQFITVIENQCASPDNTISVIGSPVLCTGQSVTLSAPAGTGYSYLWSNGATTQTTDVSSAGEYSVKVTGPGGCSSISPVIEVKVSPDETPVIVANGDTKFCDGGSVILDGPSGWSGYHWSNGENSEDLVVTESGSYTLTIDGTCQQWTSVPVQVTVLDPTEPTVTGGSVLNSGTVDLTATGNNVEWYDAPVNGNLLGIGNNFTTPVLNTTTTYYVQSTTNFPGSVYNTGQTDHSGASAYSGSNQTNVVTYFTVYDNCVLASAKVYTDKQGERLILIKNGSTVVNSVTVNIPITSGTGTRIDLNLALSPGNYTIETDALTNLNNLGYAGPRLQRSNGGGVLYPYTIPGVLSITGNNEGTSLYYYFYDWEVVHGEFECTSDRVPVVAEVYSDVSVDEYAGNTSLGVYPNPTAGILNITTKVDIHSAVLKVLDITGKVVYTENATHLMENGVKTIDLTGMAAGIYTLEIGNAEMRHNVKFIMR